MKVNRIRLLGKPIFLPFLVLWVCGSATWILTDFAHNPARNRAPASMVHPLETLGRLPLAFEPNQGQWDPQVRFLARGRGYALFITPGEAVLSMDQTHPFPQGEGSNKAHSPKRPEGFSKLPDPKPQVVWMELEGANPKAVWKGKGRMRGTVNYFTGADASRWRTRIHPYGRLEARNVYPGVDMVYYGNAGRLEYDFVVKPGADPHHISFRFRGGKVKGVQGNGDLTIAAGDEEFSFKAPVLYQVDGSKRKAVEGRFALKGNRRVGFEVDHYDPALPLVIDPTLDYSTFLGGTGFDDQGTAIAVDTAGNSYVTGLTESTNFPTSPGAYQSSVATTVSYNVFVTKLDPSGGALLYSTYLGGTQNAYGKGIALDATGNAYVTGLAGGGFPTTSGALETSFGGGQAAFVSKLNPTGTALVYSTYVGNGPTDSGNGIAVDGSGEAFITGQTAGGFPTTSGAFQTSYGGGTTSSFAAKLNAGGTALAYSTYLGGGFYDQGSAIALDGAGNAYVTGWTESANFPTTPGAFQTTLLPAGGSGVTISAAFATKLNPAGTGLVYSTFLGGSQGAMGNGIAVDNAGDAYVTGQVASTDFPTTAGAYQSYDAGGWDAFVTKFNPAGSALVYSTYLGGSTQDVGNAIAVDSVGNAYVTGDVSPGLALGTGIIPVLTPTPTATPSYYATGTPTPLPTSIYPTTADAYQASYAGDEAAFVTELNASGNALVYSTFLGGSFKCGGAGIALNGPGNIYVTGISSSPFPTTPGSYQSAFGKGTYPICVYSGFGSICTYPTDAFIAAFSVPTPTPTPAATATPSPTSTSTPLPCPPGYTGPNPPIPGTCFTYPAPATGDTLNFAYYMRGPGSAQILVWNERGDLAAQTSQTQGCGAQASPLDIRRFAAGVYFYQVRIRYDGASGEELKPGKFAVIK